MSLISAFEKQRQGALHESNISLVYITGSSPIRDNSEIFYQKLTQNKRKINKGIKVVN